MDTKMLSSEFSDGRSIFIVKKQLEMHIIVLQDQYIADNFE